MTKGGIKDVENFLNGEAILLSSFGEKNEIIGEKEVREGGSVSGSFNVGPIAEKDFEENKANKIFHAKNKNVWRKGVSLSDASRGEERIKRFSIDKDREGG